MSAGRPTDYSEFILSASKVYIDQCEDEVIGQRLKVRIPTIEGLALYLKISRSTLYLWQKEYPEFSDIIEELQQKQADRLLTSGLAGDYNSTIAKVILTKHGYTDKQEVEQKTTIKDERIDDSKFTDEELRILAELQRKGRTSQKEGS